jgi:hypothetical protein
MKEGREPSEGVGFGGGVPHFDGNQDGLGRNAALDGDLSQAIAGVG